MESLNQQTQLAEFVSEKTGLNLSSQDRQHIFAKACRDYQREAGIDKTALHDSVSSQGFQQFIQKLLVGETYFFRHRNQFEMLRTWLRLNCIKPSLRIWSACCATGEEAYSLAIVCKELGILPQVEIIGTDISKVFVEKAKQGIYSNASFRKETPSELRLQYFQRLGPNSWQIEPTLRQAVQFFCLNLAAPCYLPLVSNMDVVLCRNVLYYLKQTVISHLLANIYRALRPKGILLVSPMENHLVREVAFTTIARGDVRSYEKPLAPPVASPITLPANKPTAGSKPDPSQKKATTLPFTTKDSESVSGKEDGPLKPCQPLPGPSSAHRRLVDEGRYLEAIEDILAHYPAKMAVEVRYYLAEAYENLMLQQEALREHERIIEERPDFILSYFAKARIYKALHRETESRQEYRKVQVILRRKDPTSYIPLTDGLQAVALLELAQQELL